MRNVLIALSPIAAFGVVIFGYHALLNIIVAVVSAVAAEKLFRLVTKQPIRIKDFSAGVTGLLLALVNPPTTPLWMTALGAVFAIIVGKEFFGGLGANIFNPALIGRAFLVMSFPMALTTWQIPCQPWLLADVVTGATPLGIIKLGGSVADVGNDLVAAGLSVSPSYRATIKTLFFGFNGGSLGETPVFIILASCFFLFVKKTIDLRAPIAMIVTGFICALIFWQDIEFALFSILTGGLIFGAVFMTTDCVTSPVTGKGKIIFGIGCGIITMLIRKFGQFPEGVCYSILIMNAAVPFLDKLLPKKYGFVRRKKEK
jgi:electron transport complex protein RnfD